MDRNRDRDDADSPDNPDTSHDSWSAWLPQLDPPLPQASAPPPASPPTPPALPPAVPPAAPPAQGLPYAAAPAPGWTTPQGWYAPPPTTYFGWAVVCTIVCFMPFGVVAIVKASQVKPRWAAGDLDGARRASRSAKAWCLLAAAVWPGAFLFFGCLGMMAGGHMSMSL